jgi:hypothetical protein
VATRLDHLGILVPRLDDAAALAVRLGFTLTARAEHRAASGAAAGSAQCSIMLDAGYVEIQEIAELASSTHLLAPAARRNFGLHTLAYGVADADAARDTCARALPVGPVLHWSREVAEPDIATTARFAFFVAPYDPADAALLCWVQHLTPAALRSPRLLMHANGARALRAAVIGTRGDPARLLARQVAAGGTLAEGAVRFADGAVEVRAAADLPPALAQAPWPAPDWFCALRIAFDDPGIVANAARREGFAVTGWGDALMLDLLRPFGCCLIAERA